MARSGNGIPEDGDKKAVKPVLTGIQARRIQSTKDTAQAWETDRCPAHAFGVVLRIRGAMPAAFFGQYKPYWHATRIFGGLGRGVKTRTGVAAQAGGG